MNTTYLNILGENMKVFYNEFGTEFMFSCFSDTNGAGRLHLYIEIAEIELVVKSELLEPKFDLNYADTLMYKHVNRLYNTMKEREEFLCVLLKFLLCLKDENVVEIFPYLYDDLTRWRE